MTLADHEAVRIAHLALLAGLSGEMPLHGRRGALARELAIEIVRLCTMCAEPVADHPAPGACRLPRAR